MSKGHSALAHHFDNMEQQRQASGLGMWLFLAQEIMFFGGAMLGYIVYRGMYHEAFIVGSHLLDVRLGTINTVVLIGSSLSMALAVRNAQLNRRGALIKCLILTMILGSVFLGIKGYEYQHKYHEHLIPGETFHFDAAHHTVTASQGHEIIAQPENVELFLSFYFALTGLHALHMIIGIGLMIWLVVLAKRNRFDSEYYAPVEITGLYWHFVDIVWIFLFPMLYLIGRH